MPWPVNRLGGSWQAKRQSACSSPSHNARTKSITGRMLQGRFLGEAPKAGQVAIGHRSRCLHLDRRGVTDDEVDL